MTVHAEDHPAGSVLRIADDRTDLFTALDPVAETDKYVFIFEFKLDNDTSALSQIKNKQYYKQYELSKKKIFLNGVTFSTEKGQIIDWQAEEV